MVEGYELHAGAADVVRSVSHDRAPESPEFSELDDCL
jgi:hypothetical protein